MYKLICVDGNKEREASSALEFGTAIHAALQAKLEGDSGLDTFTAFWESVRGKDMRYFRHSWEDLEDIGQQLMSRFERLHAKKFEIAHPMEVRLFGDIGGHRVEGTPDFLGNYKGVPSLVDFKTSSKPYSNDSIFVSDQLHLYRYLAKQQLGYEAKQLVYFVLNKNPVRIQVIVQDVDEKHHEQVIENLRLQIEELEKREVYPQNKSSCLMGAYRCGMWDYCYGGEK